MCIPVSPIINIADVRTKRMRSVWKLKEYSFFPSFLLSESLSCAWGCCLSKDSIVSTCSRSPFAVHPSAGLASSCPWVAKCTGWQQKKSARAAAWSRMAANLFLQSIACGSENSGATPLGRFFAWVIAYSFGECFFLNFKIIVYSMLRFLLWVSHLKTNKKPPKTIEETLPSCFKFNCQKWGRIQK